LLMGLLGFERELKIYEGMVSLKRGLLKKLAKTLSSVSLSFLALISLKTCIRTKALKKMQ